MPHDGRWQILCRMKGQPNPHDRPTAAHELPLVASGITALVAKRILETKGDAMSAPVAQIHPMPTERFEEPGRRASRAGPNRDTAPDVLIVGAGPAGLAAAAQLGRRGIFAFVLERGESVAASWRGRYDRLRLNTSRWTSN